jgi:hypothetical protein
MEVDIFAKGSFAVSELASKPNPLDFSAPNSRCTKLVMMLKVHLLWDIKLRQ